MMCLVFCCCAGGIPNRIWSDRVANHIGDLPAEDPRRSACREPPAAHSPLGPQLLTLTCGDVFFLQAMSLAAVTNFGSNILVTFFFEDVIDAVGSSVAFWCYGILCIVSLAFVHFVVPETKGLTLEEIDAKLNRRSAVKEEVVAPLQPIV